MNDDILNKINIKKKKSARHVHFAVVADTGELVSIETVQSGLACNCICAACGKQMEARKGDIRMHHFAHVSNYDCLYGFEISVYKAFYAILKKQKSLFLPDAILRFKSFKKEEIVRKAFLQALTDTSYECDEKQYPPTLLCYVGDYKLQVILDIDYYYNNGDIHDLKRTAKDNNIALLVIHIPDIDSLFTLDELIPYVSSIPESKEWIYNRVIEDYDKKYREAAIKPEKFLGGCLCLAQKNKYKNVYAALEDDCEKCQYCYDIHSENLCLAHSYINHVEDFKKTIEERKEAFEVLNKIKPIKKIADYNCPVCKAPLRLVKNKNGVFAGCSNYPKCKKTFSVEPTTEQLIINENYFYK